MSKFVFKADVFVRESHYFDCRACGGNGTAIISLGSKYPTMAALCERCVEQLHDDLGKHIESLKPKPAVPEDPLESYAVEFMKQNSYLSTIRKRPVSIVGLKPNAEFILPAEEYGFQCPCVMTKIPECKACAGEKVIWFDWSSISKKGVAFLNIINRYKTANGLGESFMA